MSNPGVILLGESKISKFNRFQRGFPLQRFQVEDNIGECIHIHFNQFRLDLSIEDFLSFSSLCKEALNNLDLVEGLNLSNIDPMFLKSSAAMWGNVEKVVKTEIPLDDLQCIEYTNKKYGFFKLVPIRKTPAYLFLSEGENRFRDYQQDHYFGSNNKKRLNYLKKSLVENGYPHQNKYIILFGNQNIIRDGQHRAAVLLHIKGKVSIPVMRVKFRDGYKRHLVRKYSQLPGHLLQIKDKISQIYKKIYREMQRRNLINKV